jgi:N-methylhydantoinase B
VIDRGEEHPAHKCAGLAVPHDAIVSHRTGGGGGYGDPRERDTALVEQDLLDGYISPRAARDVYGRDVDGS